MATVLLFRTPISRYYPSFAPTVAWAFRSLSDDAGAVAKKKAVKKKQKKQDDEDDDGSAGGRDKILNTVLKALDAPFSQPPPASDEEMQRRHEIGRNYVIGRFRRHNAYHHDLSCKMKLKLHAIDMLPRNSKLKEAALADDWEMPPMWRRIPVDTPPIPGFDPTEFEVTDS